MKYTNEHEWLKFDGGIATIGITEFATVQLGDLVFVELPKVGSSLNKGAPAAVVESVKTASDVYAPLSGEVVEVNDAVAKDPTIISSDPIGAGWLYKLRFANETELEVLLDEAAYKALIG